MNQFELNRFDKHYATVSGLDYKPGFASCVAFFVASLLHHRSVPSERRRRPIGTWRVCTALGLFCALGLQATGARSAGEAPQLVPQLILAALSQHPALRAQAGLGEAAQADIERAKWQYWPTPSLGVERANASSSDPNYRGDGTVSTLRLQQPLWTGGRLDGSLSKAEAQAMLARAELEEVRQQLALRVIQACSEAAAAQGKVVANEQSRDVHARLLGLVERRTLEGASAHSDIELARSRLDGVEAELAAARAQRDTALDKLRLLTGRSLLADELSDLANMKTAGFPVITASLADLLEAARAQSPQLAKARAKVDIAQADIAVAKSTLSPEVYLRAERQYGSYSTPSQDPQNRIFIGLTSAFGAGLSSLSGVDAAVARQRAAIEDIQAQQLAVDEQVQSDATLARTAKARRVSLERVRASAGGVSASWERQFLAGRKQWQDLMNAAREETQADVQLVDAIATQHLTGWRLAVLTRGLDALLAGDPQPMVKE